jgi:hypothetical protein
MAGAMANPYNPSRPTARMMLPFTVVTERPSHAAATARGELS